METSISVARPRAVIWTARGVQTLVVLFALFDVFGKYAVPAPVADAFARQGMPVAFAPLIGTLLLIITVLYAIPRTSVLGVILLTGYLGGACATNLRAQFPAFEILFPVIFGIVAWLPVYLLDERVRGLIPLRRNT